MSKTTSIAKIAGVGEFKQQIVLVTRSTKVST